MVAAAAVVRLLSAAAVTAATEAKAGGLVLAVAVRLEALSAPDVTVRLLSR